MAKPVRISLTNYDAAQGTNGLGGGGGGGGASVSDTAYASGWNGDTANAPSKNAVYDKIESLANNLDGGNANSVGVAALAINGGTASAVILDFYRYYLECDY